MDNAGITEKVDIKCSVMGQDLNKYDHILSATMHTASIQQSNKGDAYLILTELD